MILVALATAALVAITVVIVARPGGRDDASGTRAGTAVAPPSDGGPDAAAGGPTEGEAVVEGDGTSAAPAGDRSGTGADDGAGDGAGDAAAADLPTVELAPGGGGAAPQLPRPNLGPRIPGIPGPISLRIVETGNALLSDQPGCGVTETRVVVEIDQQPRSQPYRWHLVATSAGQDLGRVGVQVHPTPERLLLTFGSVAGLPAGPIAVAFSVTDPTGRTASLDITGFRIARPGCR